MPILLSGDILDVFFSSFSACTILTEAITSKMKIRTPGLRIFSLLNYESESERKSQGLNLFRKCGLLLWLVRAQHDHYQSGCERKSGGIHLPFHCESEIKSSVRMAMKRTYSNIAKKVFDRPRTISPPKKGNPLTCILSSQFLVTGKYQ